MTDAWRSSAACRPGSGVDPEIFFRGRGESIEEAQAVCAKCPVKRECLAQAVAYGWNLNGVWAGLSERQRKALIERRPTPEHGTDWGYKSHLRRGEETCWCCKAAHAAAQAAWEHRHGGGKRSEMRSTG